MTFSRCGLVDAALGKGHGRFGATVGAGDVGAYGDRQRPVVGE